MGLKARSRRPLWRCPRCGHRFVTANMWHSCGNYPLADHFRGRPPLVRATFDAWADAARACGPTTIYAQKTRIVFQHRVRFAGATIRAGWVSAGLWLPDRVTHERLVRVEDFGALGWGMYFRLETPDHVDRTLRHYMCLAWHRVGSLT